ncbi:MAG: hypothetical protein ABIP85_14950 [Chthoniobacteraceae bacterium]
MTPETKRPREIDTVMAEVRRVKAELMKRYNYDMAAMFRDARARQWESGHKVVTRAARDKVST